MNGLFHADLDRLRRLLDNDLPEPELSELTAHLESCADCRCTLEELAAGSRVWGDLRLLRGSPLADDLPKDLATQPFEEGHEEADLERMLRVMGLLETAAGPDHIGRVGPYEILGVIGRGGMGIVLRGRDRALDRLVAVKVLLPGLAEGAAARRRFAREAKAAAAVVHEHVVAIHAVDVTPAGIPYLVMQYVAGKSLQQRLDQDGPLEIREILRIGRQAASALAAAHAQGLIHRDVKPANILLENGVERVKITDFGLARAVDDGTLSQPNVVVGTPQYMAPEQARGEAVDHRADLFSLGGVLYALCTGRAPFQDRSSVATLKQVCEEPATPIRAVNPDIPVWLSRLIDRLLAKDPAARFASAAEVADLLGRCLAHLEQPNTVSLPPELVSAPASPAKRRSPASWLIAASLVLAVALGLGSTRGTAVAQQVADYVAAILRIHTADGTLVIEADDPNVKVQIDGEEVVVTGAGPQEVRLRSGPHRLQAVKDGVPVLEELVSISRGGKHVVTIRREPVVAAPGRTTKGLRMLDHPDLAFPIDIVEQPPGRPGSVSAPPTTSVARPSALPPGTISSTPSQLYVDGEWPVGPFERTNPCGMVPFSPAPPPNAPAPPPTDFERKRWISSLAFSPDGKFLAVATGGTTGFGGLHVRDLSSGETRSFSRSAPGVRLVAFSPDGKLLAQVNGGRVILREFPSCQVLQTLKPQASAVTSIAFSPDGRTLATGLFRAVTLWDVAAARETRILTADMQQVWSLAFAPDGRTLASGATGGVVRLWNVAAGRVRQPLIGHQAGIFSVALSPDGRTVASGSDDTRIGLWDARTGRLHTMLIGHDSAVSSLAFRPDGKSLVSGSGGESGRGNRTGEVIIWDLTEEPPAQRRIPYEGRVWTVAFSPDGRTIAYAGDDRSVTIYDVAEKQAHAYLFDEGKETGASR